MSKYFKPIDFDPPASPETERVPFPEAEAFRAAIEKYREEIERIQRGTSNLVPKAVQFPKGICIPSVVLDRFYSVPSERTLKDFLDSCAQDFGARMATTVAEWFSETYPPAANMVK